MLHMTVIQYMLVSKITVTNKYICTLIYNCTITQHTHIILSQKCHIRIYKYFVHLKTHHMKQHTMLCSSCLQKSMQDTTIDITCNITLTSMSSEHYKVFTNDIFVDVSIYQTIDHELCHHCVALPCKCVQMDIMMTARKVS